MSFINEIRLSVWGQHNNNIIKIIKSLPDTIKCNVGSEIKTVKLQTDYVIHNDIYYLQTFKSENLKLQTTRDQILTFLWNPIRNNYLVSFQINNWYIFREDASVQYNTLASNKQNLTETPFLKNYENNLCTFDVPLSSQFNSTNYQLPGDFNYPNTVNGHITIYTSEH